LVKKYRQKFGLIKKVDNIQQMKEIMDKNVGVQRVTKKIENTEVKTDVKTNIN